MGKQEKRCPSDDGNGLEYTTAWYVDYISTPYGLIRFSYDPRSHVIKYKRSSISTEAGIHPFPGEYNDFRYAVSERTVVTDFKQEQALVDEITWEGNRI